MFSGVRSAPYVYACVQAMLIVPFLTCFDCFEWLETGCAEAREMPNQNFATNTDRRRNDNFNNLFRDQLAITTSNLPMFADDNWKLLKNSSESIQHFRQMLIRTK